MDVSALLNAAPPEARSAKSSEPRSCPSPKKTSTSTPTQVTENVASDDARVADTRGRCIDTLPLPYRCSTHPFNSSDGEQDSKVDKTKVEVHQPDLHCRQQLEVYEGSIERNLATEPRVHRFSDSLSSVSSYESMSSQPHSRTSSVTTLGDEPTSSVSYAAAYYDDTKLATVEEGTLLRFQSMNEGQRRTSRSSRPSLVINTNPSTGRSGRQRRYAKTMSSIRGAKSSGCLPGYTLLPPAYGSSTSDRQNLHAPGRHTRTLSAPGFSSQDRRLPNSSTSDLPQSCSSTMDPAHPRDGPPEGAAEALTYPSSRSTSNRSEAYPALTSQEPGTPESAFSYIHLRTPQSGTSADSPFYGSPSSTNAELSRRTQTAMGTPTRPTRARANTEIPEPLDVFPDERCVAEVGCMQSPNFRKAISHFFGRNKKCTLLIPAHVWINICRKHYQRTRYRKSAEYSLFQIRLIMVQIDKIEAWEKTFTDKGQPSPITGWTVALRKRQSLANSLATPAWIHQASGSNQTIDQIRQVVANIQKELEHGLYQDIPEIEFLPDITSGVVKSPTRRTTKNHYRNASVASSASSNNIAGRSRSSSMMVNICPPSPEKAADNPYYQAARLHARRVQETAQWYAERAAQQGMPPPPVKDAVTGKDVPRPQFLADMNQYHYRHDGVVVHKETGEPLLGGHRIGQSISQPLDAQAFPVNFHHRIKSEFEGGHAHDSLQSSAGYDGGHGNQAQAFGDRLPSFESCFGQTLGHEVKRELPELSNNGVVDTRLGDSAVDHGGLAEATSIASRSASEAHAFEGIESRPPFAVMSTGQGQLPGPNYDTTQTPIFPRCNADGSNARAPYDTIDRGIYGAYDLASPYAADRQRSQLPTNLSQYPPRTFSGVVETATGMQSMSDYGYPYLVNSMGHHPGYYPGETPRVGAYHYRQHPADQWASGTPLVAMPQIPSPTFESKAPVAEMDGDSGAQK